MIKKAFIFFIILISVLGDFSVQNNTIIQNSISAQDSIKIPEKIISLSPGITEEIFLLGADKLLIADTIYCRRPEEAKLKSKIGNLKDFDIERVIELKPDVLFYTPLTDRNKIKKISQFGIHTVEFFVPGTFNEICGNFLRLGESIGMAGRAQQIISAAKNEVEKIRKISLDLPRKKVFIQIGAKPLVTANKSYFINDYIEFSGGINVCADYPLTLVTREGVLTANPDIILITDMGIVSNEEKKIWDKYKSINAVKNKKIYTVDSDIFCNPTLVTFLEALKITFSLLHPESAISNN